jgi:hypothetical protein
MFAVPPRDSIIESFRHVILPVLGQAINHSGVGLSTVLVDVLASCVRRHVTLVAAAMVSQFPVVLNPHPLEDAVFELMSALFQQFSSACEDVCAWLQVLLSKGASFTQITSEPTQTAKPSSQALDENAGALKLYVTASSPVHGFLATLFCQALRIPARSAPDAVVVAEPCAHVALCVILRLFVRSAFDKSGSSALHTVTGAVVLRVLYVITEVSDDKQIFPSMISCALSVALRLAERPQNSITPRQSELFRALFENCRRLLELRESSGILVRLAAVVLCSEMKAVSDVAALLAVFQRSTPGTASSDRALLAEAIGVLVEACRFPCTRSVVDVRGCRAASSHVPLCVL